MLTNWIPVAGLVEAGRAPADLTRPGSATPAASGPKLILHPPKAGVPAFFP
jgi:hypothetical protein